MLCFYSQISRPASSNTFLPHYFFISHFFFHFLISFDCLSLSFSLSLSLSVSLPLSLSLCLSLFLSIYLSICLILSISLPLSLSISYPPFYCFCYSYFSWPYAYFSFSHKSFCNARSLYPHDEEERTVFGKVIKIGLHAGVPVYSVFQPSFIFLPRSGIDLLGQFLLTCHLFQPTESKIAPCMTPTTHLS